MTFFKFCFGKYCLVIQKPIVGKETKSLVHLLDWKREVISTSKLHDWLHVWVIVLQIAQEGIDDKKTVHPSECVWELKANAVDVQNYRKIHWHIAKCLEITSYGKFLKERFCGFGNIFELLSYALINLLCCKPQNLHIAIGDIRLSEPLRCIWSRSNDDRTERENLMKNNTAQKRGFSFLLRWELIPPIKQEQNPLSIGVLMLISNLLP